MEIKWDDTINLFRDLNSLHILFYESPRISKNQTRKIFIKSSRKLKANVTRKKT